jgi:putative ABC transport system permease protein
MEPAAYVPYRQQTEQWPGPGWSVRAGMAYIIRSNGKPEAMVAAMRNALAELEPNRPAEDVATIEEYLSDQVRYDRLYLALLTIFGAIAVVLAAIGIYGVMAYAVAERTREIGIRMALGAKQGQVLTLVARRAAILIGAGLLVGFAGAYALTRLLREQLYEVSPTDPLTFAVVSALLAAVAALACVIPTRRAVAVDPTVALRYE